MTLRWRYDNAGRIQPTAFGRMLHPGLCMLCSRPGNDPDEVFANLGVELEDYGSVYLCLECCAEVASFIEFKAPDAYDTLLDSIENYRTRNIQLSNQLAEAKRLLDVRIESAGYRELHSDGSVDVPLFEVDSAADEVDRILNDHESKPAKSGTK